jgi:hypothetical protein
LPNTSNHDTSKASSFTLLKVSKNSLEVSKT